MPYLQCYTDALLTVLHWYHIITLMHNLHYYTESLQYYTGIILLHWCLTYTITLMLYLQYYTDA